MSTDIRHTRWARFVSISLVSLVAWQIPAGAQQETEILAPALKIVVAKGQEGTNNIKKSTAVEPLVVVSDEKNLPVSGVMIMFTLPESGPSGVFANGSKSVIVYSDAEGRAIGRGLRPNQVPGKFQIAVDASFHGLAARAVINQTNVMPSETRVSSKLIAILAIAAGAAAAGVVAASSGGTTSSVPPGTSSTTLSLGTPTFGSPK